MITQQVFQLTRSQYSSWNIHELPGKLAKTSGIFCINVGKSSQRWGPTLIYFNSCISPCSRGSSSAAWGGSSSGESSSSGWPSPCQTQEELQIGCLSRWRRRRRRRGSWKRFSRRNAAPERSSQWHSEGHFCILPLHHRLACTFLRHLLLFLRKEASADLHQPYRRGNAGPSGPIRGGAERTMACGEAGSRVCSRGVDVHQTKPAFRGRALQSSLTPGSKTSSTLQLSPGPGVHAACRSPAGARTWVRSKAVPQPQQHLGLLIWCWVLQQRPSAARFLNNVRVEQQLRWSTGQSRCVVFSYFVFFTRLSFLYFGVRAEGFLLSGFLFHFKEQQKKKKLFTAELQPPYVANWYILYILIKKSGPDNWFMEF